MNPCRLVQLRIGDFSAAPPACSIHRDSARSGSRKRSEDTVEVDISSYPFMYISWLWPAWKFTDLSA